jgi:hydroxymethylpyrimidine/phosphomethylpyrimidine kinase
MKPVALSIAGSDPSGGAGIQADLKTFHQFGVYGEAVITLLTVQNTVEVRRVQVLDPDLVAAQMEAVLEDIPPHAVKTGALGNAAVVRVVAVTLLRFPCNLVVDPVMISKHGAALMEKDAQERLIRDLLPLARLVTPNLHEAAALSGIPVHDLKSMREAGRRILALGPKAVLVKGGHLPGAAVDLLMENAEEILEYPGERIDTPHTHGTGCTYSAAITAGLAAGLPLARAVARAKSFIAQAIRGNPGLGRGAGPVNHHAPVD